jgi:hypothetical protein
MKINRFTQELMELDTFHVFEDFAGDQTDLFFTDTITDTGTAAVGDEATGVMVLTPSDGSVADNDEVYLATANELFLVAAGRRLYARGKVKFTETTSGVFNAAVGFASAVAANLIVDDGGGMRASGNIFAVHKIDGETVWRLTTRNGSAVTTTVSTKSATSTAYQDVEIEINDWDGVSVSVVAKVDGEYLKDANGLVIRHTVLVSGSTEMQLFAGAKLGAITNNDALKIDWLYGAQTR